LHSIINFLILRFDNTCSMQKILVVIFLVFGYLNGFSQNVSVQISPDVNDEFAYPEIFGINEQSFFAISSKSENEFYIECITNKELRRVFKRQVELPKIDGKANAFENILYFNSHIYLFSSHHDKKLKKYAIYINEIKPNGELSLNHTLIDEVSFSDKNYDCKYTIKLSSDSNRVILFRETSESNDVKGKIVYKVVSKGLKSVFEKEIELNQPLNKTMISNVFMDDEQNIYYTEKQYYKIEGESGDFTKLYVASFKSEDDTLYRSEIAINEKRFLDVQLKFSSQGNLICSGNYGIDKNTIGNWEENHSLKGLFYTVFDAEKLNVLSQGQYSMQELMPEEKFYRYYLTNTFQFEDNILVVCEFQNTICDNGSCDTKYGDLLVASFNLKEKQNMNVGKLETSLKGEKLSCKGGTMSFVPYQANKTAHLLYNCNRQFEISADGNVVAKSIFDSSSNADLSFMKYSCPINKETMLFLTYSKKTGHRFAKFSFIE
jgi:hypothetical protein